MRIRFHPAASAELLAACDWYEEQRPGLGAELRDEFQHALATIASQPEAWPPVGDMGVRRFLLPRFPYAILYTARDAELVIVAVAHAKRRPGYWAQRLGGAP